MEGKGRIVVLRARGNGESPSLPYPLGGYGNDGAVMLGWNGMLVTLLASVLLVASQGITVRTELAFFFCRTEREVLIYLQRDSGHNGGSCCGETIELFSIVLLRV